MLSQEEMQVVYQNPQAVQEIDRIWVIAEKAQERVKYLEYMLRAIQIEMGESVQHITEGLTFDNRTEGVVRMPQPAIAQEAFKTGDTIYYRWERGRLIASRTTRSESVTNGHLTGELVLAGVLPFYGRAEEGDAVAPSIWDGVPFVGRIDLTKGIFPTNGGEGFEEFIQARKK